MLDNKRIVVTGGTGSLGRVLVKRLLSGELGNPDAVVVFSRDEAKQHEMRLSYQNRNVATDEVIYDNSRKALQFRIGYIQKYEDVCSVLDGVDIVINCAALKQVPVAQYQPDQAIETNIMGPRNIERAIRENRLKVDTAVDISSDKATSPYNVYGKTKSLGEDVFIAANLHSKTRYICVKWGNVLASRGSVIPKFHEQIRMGGPVTVTTKEMTRFQITLEQAVDAIFTVLRYANRGEIYIPKIPTIRIMDLAEVLIGDRPIGIEITGIRPGEKIHELLVCQEEAYRTIERNGYYVVLPMLPELCNRIPADHLTKEVTSADGVINKEDLLHLLKANRLMVEDGAITDTLGSTYEA